MNITQPESYSKTPEGIWSGRNDGADPDVQRWHQRIILINLVEEPIPDLQKGQKGIALIGFACDEGVRRNGGRTGAKDGPSHLRSACSNLPVHFDQDIIFIDLGDITCKTEAMEDAQTALAALVTMALNKGYQPFVIGGGHEVAYAHYTGINNHIDPDNTIGIINFDAHFDLREPVAGVTNSGTGFLQIANDCRSAKKPFSYLPIGIQQNSNTRQLYNTAAGLGVKCIPASQFSPGDQQDIFDRIEEFISSVNHIYLTICMDVFSSSVAPGVSAQAYSGLFPDAFFFKVLDKVIESKKLISMDIAEYNPLYDTDQRTAKLAAALAFRMVTKSN